MNEVYLCRSCAKASLTDTAPGSCRHCGACSWHIVKPKLDEMTWYSRAAKLRIMQQLARAQAARERKRQYAPHIH